jgi:hypothetical protein
MPYTVNSFQGINSAITVLDKTVDSTSLDIKLVGKKQENYGEIILENFYHILENFAGLNPPPNPVKGQIWARTDATPGSDVTIKIYNGTGWDDILTLIDVGATLPSPAGLADGKSFFVNTSKEEKFYIKVGTSWKQVGGLIRSATVPTPIPPSGTLWYNETERELYVRINNIIGEGWYPLTITNNNPGSKTRYGIHKNTAPNFELAIIEVNGKLIAAFSDSDVNSVTLNSVNYVKKDNTTETLGLSPNFHQGIESGLTFSDNVKNITFTSSAVMNTFGNNLEFRIANTSRMILESNKTVIKSDVEVSSNGFFKLPKGTTAQRPPAEQGMIRFNTDTGKLEYFDGLAWKDIAIGNTLTKYQSPEFNIPNNSSITYAHGLPNVPKIYHAYALCKMGYGSYSVGDEILLAHQTDYDEGSSPSRDFFTTWANNSVIGFAVYGTLRAADKDGSGFVNLASPSFTIFFRYFD